jgi:putative DNA primase/helicase
VARVAARRRHRNNGCDRQGCDMDIFDELENRCLELHGENGKLPLTDTGNALRLASYYGLIIRYVPAWGAWIIWDGTRWRRDDLNLIVELAKNVARFIHLEAAEAPDGKALGMWASKSEGAHFIQAMLKLTQSIATIAVDARTLDTNRWLLNCANGTLDLRTNELRPAEQDDLITKSTEVNYVPGAKCPQFEKFLLWAMHDRPWLVDYLQRTLGYSLSGDVSRREVYFLHGNGRNGKSTLLKTVRATLGDYAIYVPSSTFVAAERQGGATPDRARLKGSRFVCTSEMEDGAKLATAMLKNYSGDEPVSARELYKSSIEFFPESKFWIASNDLPIASAIDQALWDRLKLVPFEARISDEDQDKLLGEKLITEAEGILAWLVEGFKAGKNGIDEPDEVFNAGQQYRKSMDFFADFLADHFTEGGTHDYGRGAVHFAYKMWANSNEAPVLKPEAFKRQMTEHGWELKAHDGIWRWRISKAVASKRSLAAAIRAAIPIIPSWGYECVEST